MKYLIKQSLCIEPVLRKSVHGQKPALPILVCVVAALGCSALSSAQNALEAPRSGLINPASAAFNPATGKAYVVDEDKGAVTVSDDAAGRVVTVQVGAGPVSIATDSGNGSAYVLNASDGTVSVLDGKTDTVVATLKVGDHPYSIAADSAAGKIYVTRTYSDQLMIIDAATNQVSSVKAGSPDLLAIDSKKNTVYMLGYEGGNLSELNGATHALTHGSVGMHAWGMAVDETTGLLYVARPGNAEVAVMTPGASSPKMIPTGHIPCSIAVNARTHTVYVANYADNSVTVIDGVKNQPVATLAVGKRPEALAVDAEHNRVYVANTQGNSVTIIDGAGNRVIATLDAGKAPYALAMNPRSEKLHVANLDKQSFTILDVHQTEDTSRPR